MLKLRVITALALLPIVIWGTFFTSHENFAVGLAVVTFIGALEWTRLAGFSLQQKLIFLVLFVAVMLATAWQHYSGLGGEYWQLLVACAFWLLALFSVLTFPRSANYWEDHSTFKFLIGLVLLVPTWLALVVLHGYDAFALKETTLEGPYLVLVVLLLVWAADTGAYFAGRKFGKNKLAPQVSPGKSWEGVIGGLILVAAIFIGLSYYLSLSLGSTLVLTLVAILTAGFSVVGDLTESMFKRRIGMKDSGKILPGHGGILDRIDSLTAAAPVFAAALLLLEGKL